MADEVSSVPWSLATVCGLAREVERPALVEPIQQHYLSARSQRPFAPATAAHLQPFLAVDAQQLLVVRSRAFPCQKVAQATKAAEPVTLRRQREQPLPQRPLHPASLARIGSPCG